MNRCARLAHDLQVVPNREGHSLEESPVGICPAVRQGEAGHDPTRFGVEQGRPLTRQIGQEQQTAGAGR